MILGNKVRAHAVLPLLTTVLCLLAPTWAPSEGRSGDEVGDSPYAALEWLLGTWRGSFLPPGAESPPEMTFEWGEGKGFLRYRSMQPDGTLEYAGMIVWHPIERRHVFLKSYVTAGPTLMETGWIELLPDDTARFHMSTHYTPGIALPWSNGAKAGREGTTLSFRRTLSFRPGAGEEKDRLFGEFLMRRGSEWVHPDFGFEVPEQGFEWHRLQQPKQAKQR